MNIKCNISNYLNETINIDYLSLHTGLSKLTIQAIINNQYMCSVRSALLLSYALNVSVDRLFELC